MILLKERKSLREILWSPIMQLRLRMAIPKSMPFERLWWDETVSTVVTRAEPHNQDRVLKIRENARLQGFPDFYKLYGPTKERYIQVGNAVAIPVSRSLGLALLGIADDQPLCSLLSDFSSFIRGQVSSEEVDEVSPL